VGRVTMEYNFVDYHMVIGLFSTYLPCLLFLRSESRMRLFTEGRFRVFSSFDFVVLCCFVALYAMVITCIGNKMLPESFILHAFSVT